VTIEGNCYFNVYKDVVLTGSFKHGHSFSYSDKHITNKFTMGGGIANKIMPYGMLSLKNVPLRGYSDKQFKLGKDEFGINGANYFDVMTAELRVMLFDLGMFKMFGLGFVEAGILYNDFKSLDLENLKRSYGFGFRVLVPMFGVLGIDWGRGIDNKKREWEFHFQIGV
jgi:outer membrane protein insertion porin family